MTWSISIKTVGNLSTTNNVSNNNNTSNEQDFTISISPDEALDNLQQKIESVTGLKVDQQRLIYRGRLISGSGSTSSLRTTATASAKELKRICDVDGLEDGHTIHLVPKRASQPASSATSSSTTTTATTAANNSDAMEEGPLGSGGAGGLLSALLAIGRENSNATTTTNGTTVTAATTDADVEDLFASASLPRSSRMARRRRPNSHRRLVSDPRFPHPCPLEPVRQGLMTLHTMLGTDEDYNRKQEGNNEIDGRNGSRKIVSATPLDANRKFFRGQWIDVRDTVNQWLEATVVEIMAPDDILISSNTQKSTAISITSAAIDPAVGANDLEGRRRLLVEPSSDSTDRTLADLNNLDELVGYTSRPQNDKVQLLKIHYNGWPHRWDEWIRSDSERIRVFRTRSRHVQSRSHLCPSPESNFTSAPRTFIKSEDDGGDRMAVLPEIYRTMMDVQGLFGEAIKAEGVEGLASASALSNRNHARRDFGEEEKNEEVRPLSMDERSDLMMAMQELKPDIIEEVLSIVQGDSEGGKSMDPSDIDIAALDHETQWKLKKLLEDESLSRGRSSSRSYNFMNNDNLPWDSSLHGSSCRERERDIDDDSLDEDVNVQEEQDTMPDFDKKKLEALAPLLDRLGRILIDAAPHVATLSDHLPDPPSNEEAEAAAGTEAETGEEGAEAAIISLRPSWSNVPPASLFESDSNDTVGNANDVTSASNPDYVDFVHGFINHRNEGNYSARRTARRSQSDGSVGSSLLSGFLASALGGGSGDGDGNGQNGRNGPRIVRVGGTGGGDIGGSGGSNGNGIDIHIHAVVTGPGAGGDGMPDLGELADMMNRAGAASTPTPERTDFNAPPGNPPAVDEEDLGLFNDLYSEDPPVFNYSNNEESVEIEDDEAEEEDVSMEDHDSDASSDEEPDMPPLIDRNVDDSDSSDDDDSFPGLMGRDEGNSSSDDDSSDDDKSIPGLALREIPHVPVVEGRNNDAAEAFNPDDDSLPPQLLAPGHDYSDSSDSSDSEMEEMPPLDDGNSVDTNDPQGPRDPYNVVEGAMETLSSSEGRLRNDDSALRELFHDASSDYDESISGRTDVLNEGSGDNVSTDHIMIEENYYSSNGDEIVDIPRIDDEIAEISEIDEDDDGTYEKEESLSLVEDPDSDKKGCDENDEATKSGSIEPIPTDVNPSTHEAGNQFPTRNQSNQSRPSLISRLFRRSASRRIDNE